MAKKPPKKPANKVGLSITALAVVTAIATAIAAGFTDGIKDTTKSITKQGIAWVQEGYERVFPSTLPQADKNAALSILVARFDGDTDGSQTQFVLDALRQAFGRTQDKHRIDVYAISRLLKKKNEPTRADAANQQEAERTGQEWLAQSGAHILIWGRAVKANEVLQAFFVLNDAKLKDPFGKNRKLVDALVLPPDFQQDLGLVVAAKAMWLAAPIYEENTLVADVLDDLYPRLKAVAALGVVGRSSAQCDLQWTVANVAQTLGEEKGERAPLEEAIERYRQTIRDTRCASQKGALNHDLGMALWTLGQQENEPARLDEAVGAYREALRDRPRQGDLSDWANTQINLGAALWTLGNRETGTKRLDESAGILRETREALSREREPILWASAQNNFANVLTSLGRREKETARLEQAANAYREALKVWTRERAPLRWALMQNNLGTVFQVLGEREQGTASLKEAVKLFDEALTVRTRKDVPLQWAMTESNRGAALGVIGMRESGTAALEAAVAAFRGALDAYKQASADYQIKLTEDNLARAEKLLAERRAKGS